MTADSPTRPAAKRRKRRAPAAAVPLAVPPPGRARETTGVPFTPLATERLTLRQLAPEDAGSLHRLVNDWEIIRTLAVLPFPYPRELADEWIASAIAEWNGGTAWHLAITGDEAGTEVLVGIVSLRIPPGTRTGDLGYWVGRRFWGHGVATEAVTRFAQWSFANLELDVIEAEAATDNPASAAVLRRAGFRLTGEGMGYFKARDGDYPVWKFAATRDDIFGRTEVEATESGEKPLLLVAACALIDIDGRVLLARRPEGKKMAGLWEFPGGKLNPGETPEVALIRELKEELGIDVTASCLAPFAFASHAYDRFHLLMPLFLCRRWKGMPTPREKQTLAWVRPRDLTSYEMPPADKPLIPLLRDFL